MGFQDDDLVLVEEDRTEDEKCHGIAAIRQKDIGQRVHEGYAQYPQFPVYGAGDVKVVSVRKSPMNGGILGKPSETVADGKEKQRPSPP
jgi:hypothetical protein